VPFPLSALHPFDIGQRLFLCHSQPHSLPPLFCRRVICDPLWLDFT
jgi:hypothetical protein